MRVVITVPSLGREFGGPSDKALRLAQALRNDGDQVAVVGCGSAPGAVGLPILARFHATPIPRLLRPLPALVRGADVLHVLGYRDPVGTLAQAIAHRQDVPVVFEPVGMVQRGYRSHRLKSGFDAAVGGRLLRSADAVIATSSAEADALRSWGVSSEQIRLRPNGVDVSALEPLPPRGAFRARWQIAEDAPLILALARLHAIKGLQDLVRALPACPGAVAVIAGPDEGDGTLGDLRRLQGELGLGSRLRILTDGLWGRDKAEALADADCLVMPSESESFGQAAAEAAVLGIPVVLSDGCGVIEWLDGATVEVFPVHDVDALADRLRVVLGGRPAREEISADVSRVRSALSWAAIAGQQRDIYLAAGRR